MSGWNAKALESDSPLCPLHDSSWDEVIEEAIPFAWETIEKRIAHKPKRSLLPRSQPPRLQLLRMQRFRAAKESYLRRSPTPDSPSSKGKGKGKARARSEDRTPTPEMTQDPEDLRMALDYLFESQRREQQTALWTGGSQDPSTSGGLVADEGQQGGMEAPTSASDPEHHPAPSSPSGKYLSLRPCLPLQHLLDFVTGSGFSSRQ